jgi:hypothetical protein
MNYSHSIRSWVSVSYDLTIQPGIFAHLSIVNTVLTISSYESWIFRTVAIYIIGSLNRKKYNVFKLFKF